MCTIISAWLDMWDWVNTKDTNGYIQTDWLLITVVVLWCCEGKCLKPHRGQASNGASVHLQLHFPSCHQQGRRCFIPHVLQIIPETLMKGSTLFAWKVLFNQRSHWPLERKPNHWDGSEVPLATEKYKAALHSLWLVIEQIEQDKERLKMEWD